LLRYLWPRLGWIGVAAIAGLALLTLPMMLRGLSGGEIWTMIRRRRRRFIWLAILIGLVALLLMPIPDRAGGAFQVRPVTRAELRAKVAGFVREVRFDEGDRVGSEDVVLVLEVPELDSRLAQKRAEIREVKAKLTLLEVGPRPEERREQKLRVERA